MIPKLDRKWSPILDRNDPQIGPQMITTLDQKWSPYLTSVDLGSQMIPKLHRK